MIPSRQPRELADPGTMTPMIDVVFLLLIFFVWTASFQIVEQLMPGTFAAKQAETGAAAAETESVSAESEIVVLELEAAPEGVVPVLNGRRLGSWNEVRITLVQVLEIDRETPVVIDPDPGVSYGTAIKALDLARAIGLENVHFAAPAAASDT